MHAKKGLSLLCFIIGLFFITSVSYAWINPGPYTSITPAGLKLKLIDNKGNELPDLVMISEDNVYPGWSKEYVLRIKNSGDPTNYTIGVDFEYDKSNGLPHLADVLTLKKMRNNQESKYNLVDLLTSPLQGVTKIARGEVHEYNLVLAMDENAGNEYQNLTNRFDLTITAELAGGNNNPGGSNGGNGGGGGGGNTPEPNEPTSEPEPEQEPGAEPEEGTEEPESDVMPDSALPDAGEDKPEITAGINEALHIEVLPKTGGIPYQLFLAIGIVFIALGYWLRKVRI